MPLRLIVLIALTVGLGGCGAVGAIGLPLGGARGPTAPPQDFAVAAPTQPVQSADLPPLPGAIAANDPFGGPVAGDFPPDPNQAQFGAAPVDPLTPGVSGQIAAAPGAPAPAGGAPVGRTDLLGGWTILSGTESCQLFMTLTTWSGGYRASTRGCTSDSLNRIAAWNLVGSEVVLAADGGAPLARLVASTTTRFDGRIEAVGTPVSFYR